MQIQEIMKYGDYSINNKHVLITSELSDDHIYIFFKNYSERRYSDGLLWNFVTSFRRYSDGLPWNFAISFHRYSDV